MFRSLKHIYAQIINDEAGTTLVSASSLDKIRQQVLRRPRSATVVGELIAKRALEAGSTRCLTGADIYITDAWQLWLKLLEQPG